MALIKCSECQKEVSDKAEACPNCGNVVRVKISAIRDYFIKYYKLLTLLFIALFFWWSLIPKNILKGVWQGDNEKIEIFSNGSININGSGGGSYEILDNPYTILGNGRAEVRLNGLGAVLGPIVVEYQVSAGWLDLTQGKSTKNYKRISPAPKVRLFLEWLSGQIAGVI